LRGAAAFAVNAALVASQ